MKRSIIPLLLIALLVSGALAAFLLTGAFSVAQRRLADATYGTEKPLRDIVIVGIDDKSVQEFGQWPWTRDHHIRLLSKLAGAKGIGLDIAFFEPTNREHDTALGIAMRQTGSIVIATEAAQFTNNGSVESWLRPISSLHSISTGAVNVYTDPDGVTRAVPALLNGEPGFALAVAEKAVGRRPVLDQDRFLVNFVGKPGSFPTYSYADVVQDRVPPDAFANKIVFVGATARDLRDDYLVPTSLGRRMPGVEVHAHALQTILTRTFLERQSLKSTLAGILALALLTALVFWLVRPVLASIIAFLLLAGIALAAVLLFQQGVLINLVYLPLAVVLTCAGCVAFVAWDESRQRRHLHSVLGRYVSKDVVEHLLEHKESLALGGQERDISVLFADIRGFTPLAEKMRPKEAIGFLNTYFGRMTDVVFRNNGTLDKFLGDGLMAVFNALQHEPDHAFKAVRTALEMQAAWKSIRSGKATLGIGVHTGTAVVGNMGSAQRQEFTAIGDTVNTASRVCNAAEGGKVLITEQTYEHVKGRVVARKLKPLVLKGKQKPVVVYEVLKLKKQPEKPTFSDRSKI